MRTVLVRTSYTIGVAALLLAAAGCEEATGPMPLPDGVEFRTTSEVYPVQGINGMRTVTLTARITNAGTRPVYYSYCSERILKLEALGRSTVWAPLCPAIAVPPEPISPGQTRIVNLAISEQLANPVIPLPLREGEWYRMQVRLLLKAEAPFEEKWIEIHEDVSVTNPFRITE